MEYQLAKKTIFLDRDGVINREAQYLYKIDDFEFIDGIFDACLYFQNLGYKIIIITITKLAPATVKGIRNARATNKY